MGPIGSFGYNPLFLAEHHEHTITETTDEADLLHGIDVEDSDRNLTLSRLPGRRQVRVDRRRLKTVSEAPDRRLRWTELCGKSQVRLTLVSEDAN